MASLADQDYIRLGKLFPLFIALSLASASVHSEPLIELSKERLSTVKTIALLRVPESQQLVVKNLGSNVGILFGAIGGGIGALIQESANTERAQKFANDLNANKLMMGPEMAKRVTEGLASKGFQVTYLENENPRLAANGSDDYSHIDTKSDAILNIWFGTTGYASPSASAPFYPWTLVVVRLLDSSSKTILYQQTYSAGLTWEVENVDNVSGCRENTYAEADQLLSDVRKAYQGVLRCHQVIAEKIATFFGGLK